MPLELPLNSCDCRPGLCLTARVTAEGKIQVTLFLNHYLLTLDPKML